MMMIIMMMIMMKTITLKKKRTVVVRSPVSVKTPTSLQSIQSTTLTER